MEFLSHVNANVSDDPQYKRSVEPPFPETFDKDDVYKLNASNRTYERQFYSMYQYRLNTLKNRVDTNAMKKWGDGTKKSAQGASYITRKDKILDIKSGETCWVSGTVFCDLSKKLNILQDVEKGKDDTLPGVPKSYSDDKEEAVVMLEDESGRAILRSHSNDLLDLNLLVTGCIVAVLGEEVQAGIFDIIDIVYPTTSPQRPLLPISSSSSGTASKKIAIVSGLNMGNEEDIKVELLSQFLGGELGGDKEIELSSRINHLIIAGDSILPLETINDEDYSAGLNNNYGSKNVSKVNIETVGKFDNFIRGILPSIPITIMSGEKDPVECCLPQQPIHKSFLANCKPYVGSESLTLTTNPTWIEEPTRSIRLLGTSGQNISDILKYLTSTQLQAKGDDVSLQVLESCIHWQNIAPTAPDTLYCYPFDNSDPFTLSNETPHVLFAGNQDNYATTTKNWKLDADGDEISVRLISVPRFAQSGQLVLLDVDTLECEVITIYK
ncbi:DNA polymerase delta small subunit [[Candida] anglica]|uniref:DNA polymerase delta small subunit n=1 Tax=[Candida] anglica TaxID=148631 RepID=A0ABP0EN26_9ASCO